MDEKTATRICIPVCVLHLGEIEPAMIRAAELADLIELRLDCLKQAEIHDVGLELTKDYIKSLCPVIYTYRPDEQGGQRELDPKARADFWCSQFGTLLQGKANFADLEIDVAQYLTKTENDLGPVPWDRIICSHHELIGGATDLDNIYQRIIATKASLLKIAVHANEILDCIPVLRLIERARRDGREMIAVAMGDAGILTRILGPSRGAYLTYGSLDDDNATAPGQISALDLRDLYRIRSIDGRTEIMGLVGEHVIHSVSPHIHNAAFAARDLNSVYIPFEVRDLDGFMRRMVHPRTREIEWNLRGLSITAPHKTVIMKHLDWIDPVAVEIGAVNTVVAAGGNLHGYNTDAEAAIAPLHGLIDLDGARVAVIGAGGAARALLWSLRQAGAHVTVFARDVESAQITAGQFGAGCLSLEGAAFGEYQIVINATPVGTSGLSEDATPAIASQLRGATIAYDLVYNPVQTRFLSEAQEAGCQTIGGLQMLIAQAAEQFKLWTGKEAPIEVMHDAARGALGS